MKKYAPFLWYFIAYVKVIEAVTSKYVSSGGLNDWLNQTVSWLQVLQLTEWLKNDWKITGHGTKQEQVSSL